MGIAAGFSLAGLWRRQCRGAEAREAVRIGLRPLHRRFATSDLARKARSLLEQLA